MSEHFLEKTIEQLESQLKPKKNTILQSIVSKSKKKIITKDLSDKIDITIDNEKNLNSVPENKTIKTTKKDEVVWL